VTEERKSAILFAATILAARKLIDMDRNKPNMARGILWTEQLMTQRSSSKESMHDGRR
jgi:hypothetical protein